MLCACVDAVGSAPLRGAYQDFFKALKFMFFKCRCFDVLIQSVFRFTCQSRGVLDQIHYIYMSLINESAVSRERLLLITSLCAIVIYYPRSFSRVSCEGGGNLTSARCPVRRRRRSRRDIGPRRSNLGYHRVE